MNTTAETTTRLRIGEVEHGGDVDFTLRQLRDIDGVTAASFVGHDGEYDGLFTVTYGFPRSELLDRLEENGVCI